MAILQTVNGRIVPEAPPAFFKTYAIRAPLATHWKTVTCAEYECDAYLNGWKSLIDERTELGQRQAHYIRKMSGKRFTEERDDSGLTVFSFEPGQEGFASRNAEEDHTRHPVRLDREPLYVEHGGDWRRSFGARTHTRADFWVESFAENQDRLKTITDRG